MCSSSLHCSIEGKYEHMRHVGIKRTAVEADVNFLCSANVLLYYH